VPITVTWWNDLRDTLGVLRTNHYLPVDPCMKGPDTEGATARIVTHLHGGHVPPESDGYPEHTLLPGQQSTIVYPNNQPPGTPWYHDHADGHHALNVMMGMAGFYLIGDAFESALGLPSGEYEIGWRSRTARSIPMVHSAIPRPGPTTSRATRCW
jgi:spore coat protein A